MRTLTTAETADYLAGHATFEGAVETPEGVMVPTLDDDLRTEALEARIEELEAGTEYEPHAETFRHADGSATVIVYDTDAEHANPRDNDGNVATLIQENDRYNDIDDDHAGLSEARNYFGGDAAMVRRYLGMFRPDIAYYADYWHAGESYGWGYVTTAALEEHFPEKLCGDRAAYFAKHDLSPEKLLEQEVDIYRQWAEGEVYGAIHLEVGEPIVAYGEHGAYVTGYQVEEESCWGFLGYDELEDIAAEMTDSPVVS